VIDVYSAATADQRRRAGPDLTAQQLVT